MKRALSLAGLAGLVQSLSSVLSPYKQDHEYVRYSHTKWNGETYVDYYYPRVESAARGNQGVRTFAQAVSNAVNNLLSRTPDDHAIWEHPEAKKRRDDAVALRSSHPAPENHGASENVAPKKKLRADAAGNVGLYSREGGAEKFVREVKVDWEEVAAIKTVDAELGRDAELLAARAEQLSADEFDVYLMDSAQELRDANEAAAVEANDRAWVELDKIALRRSADVAEAVGWNAEKANAAGWRQTDDLKRPTLPDQKPWLRYLGHAKCPVRKEARDAYLGGGSTAPRSVDKAIEHINTGLGAAGLALLILASMPMLVGHSDIVDALVKKVNYDHIFSNARGPAPETTGDPTLDFRNRVRARSRDPRLASDAVVTMTPRRCANPKNLFVDFDTPNSHFSDYRNMLNKARRYTAGVMETAAAWVRKALKAEGKVTACI